MGRRSTGTVRPLIGEHGGRQWHARWTLADGTRNRKWRPLDPNIKVEACCYVTRPECEHRRQAKACAARMAPGVRRESATGSATETVTDYAKRWHDWREGRGLVCVKDDRARMTNHVLATIGALDVSKVTRRDLEQLVEVLDERIAKGELGWKVAGMAWNNVTRMFKDACSAKKLDLRMRDDDPSESVQGPERGDKKEKQYLWPSEFLALVSWPKVPRRWRVLFALAVYTYMRAGEIASLRWEDVSLETMTIHIHTSMDRVRKRGAIKSTKTGVSRRIPLEPTLLPLLTAMHKEAGGKGRVVEAMPSPGMLSRKLKHYLGKAGVTRAELFATDATRKAMTFHDLRATGITWMAARGDDPLRIKQRAGHASFSTTEGYIREAENLGASFGQVFPALPDLNRPDIAPGAIFSTIQPKTRGARVGATGIEAGSKIAPEPKDMAAASRSEGNESPRLAAVRDVTPPVAAEKPSALATTAGAVSDEDIEAAIVRAMLEGRGAVAETLAATLKARRAAAAGNVVELAGRRK